MDLKHLVDFFLHLDHYMGNIVSQCGDWSYVIVFLIVFIETGLIVFPFLPGDSLLFVLGALAAAGILNVGVLWILLIVAAILGDTVNYFIGTRMAQAVKRADQKVVKPEHLKMTQDFYAKYGAKAIVLARFVPIIRTIAPFMAGVGQMEYKKFAFFNITGGVFWVTIGLWAGWWFGNLSWVKANFSLVILVIVVISLIPAVLEFLKHKKGR